MLYSYKGEYPKPIPFRIYLSNGFTRTDPSTFTEEEITDAGYIAVDNCPIVDNSKVVEWDSSIINWIIRDKTPEEIELENQKFMEMIVQTTQQRLDTFAQTRNYDNLLSTTSYLNSVVPKFKQEAERALYLRDITWSTLYQILDEVNQGIRPAPQSYSDIESDLPQLTWE